MIVEKTVYEDFIQSLINKLNYKSISHPFYNPDVGPLAKEEFVKKLKNIKDQDVQEGAKILFEKHPSSEDGKKGFYFPITLMGNCSSVMECAKQELFGPLLPVFLRRKQHKSFGNGQSNQLWLRSCYIYKK